MQLSRRTLPASLFGAHRAQRPSQLVGTRGPLAAAVNPLQSADHLRDRHPLDQRGDAAGVSLTSSVEEYAANGVALQFDLDGTRTSTRGGIEQFIHKSSLLSCRPEPPGRGRKDRKNRRNRKMLTNSAAKSCFAPKICFTLRSEGAPAAERRRARGNRVRLPGSPAAVSDLKPCSRSLATALRGGKASTEVRARRPAFAARCRGREDGAHRNRTE